MFLLVLLQFLFLFALLLFLCRRFSLIISMTSWYLFFELRLLNSNVFLSLIHPFILCCIELSFHECCHYTSVVTAHVDHVVGFSIFIVFQVSSLG